MICDDHVTEGIRSPCCVRGCGSFCSARTRTPRVSRVSHAETKAKTIPTAEETESEEATGGPYDHRAQASHRDRRRLLTPNFRRAGAGDGQ